jgi:alginate O-acetyltransferase complex protein AlgI
MLFNSLHFLLFFVITTILYYAFPHKYRWAFLLAISCYFYMVFRPVYILILAFTIVIDYFAGIYLEKATNPKQKKQYLIASLIANIGCLAVFKYFNFINQNITDAFAFFGGQNNIPMLNILLPIGLSFHTFQAMSYTFEVYRGNQKAEHHFGIYALYVMYYPQLVAGPIERPQNVLHQFYKKINFDYANIVQGCKWMLWGFFVKVVIADRLSLYVNQIFDTAEVHGWLTSLVASVFFTFQIYGDFSGYSLIAIGCSKVLGIDLMVNFKRPYLSSSIREFWSRWHISLSTWFRDYLYIPLGGNRRGANRAMANIFIVFLISGLWHGANFTFIVWGALHGMYLMIEIIAEKLNFKWPLPKFTKWLFNFILVTITWIFFRATNLANAKTMLMNIFTLKKGAFYIGNASYLMYGIILIIFLMLADFNTEKLHNKYALIYNNNKVLRWVGYVFLIMMILWIGVFNGGQFIYFQF